MSRSLTKNNYIARIAILSAIAAVLMLLEFPLPFVAPDFYKLDFSEVPVLIGGFLMGPLAGCLIELVKVLLNFIINGTVTAGVGEFANLIVGCAFVCPVAWVYKKSTGTKGMVVGLIVGVVSLVVVSALMNYYLLLPAYSKAFGMPLEAFVQIGNAVNSSIVDLRGFILLAVVPFNCIKGILMSIISGILYARIGKALARY